MGRAAIIAVVGVLGAVSGCASVSAREPTLLTREGAAGTECQPLGPVQGSSGSGPQISRETQVYWARRDALGLASAKGATHVILVQEAQNGSRLEVLGYAYFCR